MQLDIISDELIAELTMLHQDTTVDAYFAGIPNIVFLVNLFEVIYYPRVRFYLEKINPFILMTDIPNFKTKGKSATLSDYIYRMAIANL